MTALELLVAELKRAERWMTPGATDYGRDRVSGGERADMRRDHSIYGEFTERVRALAMVLKRRNDDWERNPGRQVMARNGRPDLQGMRKRLRTYEGYDNVYVAFMEGCSEQSVFKERKKHGLDDYGLPREQKPLTARPSDTLRELADRTPTTGAQDGRTGRPTPDDPLQSEAAP